MDNSLKDSFKNEDLFISKLSKTLNSLKSVMQDAEIPISSLNIIDVDKEDIKYHYR